MAEVTTPPADAQKTVAATVSNTPQKLTSEEESTLLLFIGKCTYNNIGMPSVSKFAIQSKLTIQDMCNSSLSTLRQLGAALNKANSEHDPEFSGVDELKVGGVEVSKWISVIKLIIKKKLWAEHVKENRIKIASLKAEIKAAETPEEKRRRAEEQLASLSSITLDDDI